MITLFLAFATAFTLSYFAIPSIISIANKKRLFDEPNERSSHTTKTPSLGGFAIFAGAIFAIVLWTPFNEFGNLQYILCAFIIIFLIGAKDDIDPVSPSKKLIAQILAGTILVFKSHIQLKGFYGLFMIDGTLPYWLHSIISIFTILVITNAFNLIDGINGLAGSIGSLIAVTFGVWYFMIDRIEFATVAFAIAGAVMAFLKYNYTPARIFMGDTGSLLIGLSSSILVIEFIDFNYHLPDTEPYKFQSVPAVAIGIMIVPLFDTMRVFTTRILRKQSPFSPDRRHIHHLLIDYGLSHMQATFTLIFVNTFFIALVFALHDQVELHVLLAIIFLVAAIPTYWLHRNVSMIRKRALA